MKAKSIKEYIEKYKGSCDKIEILEYYKDKEYKAGMSGIMDSWGSALIDVVRKYGDVE